MKCIRGIFFGNLLIMSGLLVGCIYDGLDNCSNQSGIYISVFTLSGDNVSAPVKDATVYLFDQDNCYVGSLYLADSQINSQVPVLMPEGFETSYWAVVWGNMGDRMTYPSPQPGDAMEGLILSLGEDAQGFAVPADDLYYGIIQLNTSYNSVFISPITASVAITARGSASSVQETGYYFTLDTHYGEYGFTGIPIADEMRIKMPGVTNESNEVVTPEAYHVIHYPDPTVEGLESITISLWKTTEDGGEPRLLFSGVSIMLGEFVKLQPGQTLHVLIYYTTSGEPRVSVAITDWGQIHQWV